MSKHSKHDYLRESVLPIYKDCISCKSRTQFTCVKCGYCYSCHWKNEELERVESERANYTTREKQSPPVTIIMEQPSAGQQQIMAMGVYGRQIEPICSYRTCNHKFSIHGHSGRKCKCRHPLNYALWKSVL